LEQLAFVPYLVLLEALRRWPGRTDEGQSLREHALEVGVVETVLQAVRVLGHYDTRKKSTAHDDADKR